MRKLPLDIGFTYEDTIIEITIMLKGKYHLTSRTRGLVLDGTIHVIIGYDLFHEGDQLQKGKR